MIHVGQPSLTEPHRRFASPFACCGHRLPRPGVKVKQILEERRDDNRSIHQRAQTIYMVTSPEVNSATALQSCNPVFFLLLFCVRESCFRPRSRCGGARRSACFDIVSTTKGQNWILNRSNCVSRTASKRKA